MESISPGVTAALGCTVEVDGLTDPCPNGASPNGVGPNGAGPNDELDRLGDQIAELAVHLDVATARLLDLIREFDARGGWNNGFRNCAAWLSWRVGLSPGAAREHVRVARALGALPRLAHAFSRGELSYAKVRAFTRVATPETEERLLAFGRAGTAEHVERLVRGWRRVDRAAETREANLQHAGRELYVYPDWDGTIIVRGRLTPEVGAVLKQALSAAREALYPRQPVGDRRPVSENVHGADVPVRGEDLPSLPQQQADALALLAETALKHGVDPGAPAERYLVVVHVDAPVLAEPERDAKSVVPECSHVPAGTLPPAGQSALQSDGVRVPAGTSRRLACDASRVIMRHDRAGRLVEVDARTRTIPPAIRRALLHRDAGCRFPGCGLPFGQGHHIRHWAEGGPTTLSNLTMLCRRHHRAVHEEGYRVERLADGELQFRHPNGRVLLQVPLPPELPADVIDVLRARHEADGLALHAKTAKPGWYGETLDVSWAIDVMHPRAVGSGKPQTFGNASPFDHDPSPREADALSLEPFEPSA
jgi:5-methylcytosine-specific restriction endonuclease McrA